MHPQSTRVKVCDMTQFLTVFQSIQLGLSYPDFSFVVYHKISNILPVLYSDPDSSIGCLPFFNRGLLSLAIFRRHL